MWGIFSFLFHLLHQKIFPNFYLFEVFFNQKKLSQKLEFFQLYDDNNGRTIMWLLPIFWLKKLLRRIFFSQFFCFNKCL